MSEPTTTLKNLRHAIARAERLVFFRLYGTGDVALTGTPTALELPSSALAQVDDYWRGNWVYITSGAQSGQERKIKRFSDAGDKAVLEYPLPGAPNAGDRIEIYDLWPPSIIHAAVNRAIERAGRIFSDSVVDTTLVTEENKLRYDLNGLTKKVHRLQKVQIERSAQSVTGVLDSVTVSGTNLLLADARVVTADDQFNSWLLTTYAGTGAGSYATVSATALSGHTLTVPASSFTVAPAAGTKYRLTNLAYQTIDYLDIQYRSTDNPDYPDTLILESVTPAYYGCRLRLVYTALPLPLEHDDDTTIIPQEIIIARTCAYLHEDLLRDTRADMGRNKQLADYFHQQADSYTQQNYPTRGASQQTFQGNLGISPDVINPLNWMETY